MDELTARINELARKHKTIGLTPEETAERDKLRRQYLARFRSNLKQQLDAIRWTDEAGGTVKH
ncbi:hypothetical protein Theco_1746 [Thermobacillus composti KWC4]|uniref:UPF0291 protein Theco_1746 n=1 Tax=Thermobacillus composti (strain DSM 18247 / JCM 13945 / KWC4) TaxID=717605 RepID=L0ECA3_THECK|nr:DUF896 domain-containing protein [Thermobacillus composti]AGA57878.1 hypothetical protein Theco_1746 [Thermobacillus composti KWC4]